MTYHTEEAVEILGRGDKESARNLLRQAGIELLDSPGDGVRIVERKFQLLHLALTLYFEFIVSFAFDTIHGRKHFGQLFSFLNI